MSRFKLYAAAAATLLVALGGCAGTTQPMAERMTVAPRGDNPNLPNPVTPQGSNESAPHTLSDPTNQTGMQR